MADSRARESEGGGLCGAFGRLPVTPLLFSFDLTFCTFTLQFNSRQTHDMLPTRVPARQTRSLSLSLCPSLSVPLSLCSLPSPLPGSACIFVHFHVGNFIWFGSLWEFKLKCAFSFCFSLPPFSPSSPLCVWPFTMSCVLDKIVCCKSARNST